MGRFNSAAGIAPAILIAAFGIYAGPSKAWELNTPPVTTPELGLPASPDQGESSPSKQPDSAATTDVASAIAAPAEPVAVREEPQPVPTAMTAKPAPRVQRSLAALVADHATARTSGAEHECLANAVYFESKGEPLQGQLSVAEVVVNRTRSGRFPRNVCGVVKQKGQFSFVRGGHLPSVPRSSAAWQKAVAIAHIALQDLADGAAPTALFFHAKRVKPSWHGLRRVASVGNHVFYR